MLSFTLTCNRPKRFVGGSRTKWGILLNIVFLAVVKISVTCVGYVFSLCGADFYGLCMYVLGADLCGLCL